MGIFNSDRLEELECYVRKLEAENERLKKVLTKAEADIERACRLRQSIPDDCVPGSYCKACEFVTTVRYNYYVPRYLSGGGHDYRATEFICTKGNVCKNFIQKEIKHD